MWKTSRTPSHVVDGNSDPNRKLDQSIWGHRPGHTCTPSSKTCRHRTTTDSTCNRKVNPPMLLNSVVRHSCKTLQQNRCAELFWTLLPVIQFCLLGCSQLRYEPVLHPKTLKADMVETQRDECQAHPATLWMVGDIPTTAHACMQGGASLHITLHYNTLQCTYMQK